MRDTISSGSEIMHIPHTNMFRIPPVNYFLYNISIERCQQSAVKLKTGTSCIGK